MWRSVIKKTKQNKNPPLIINFGDLRSTISPKEPGFGLLVSEMPRPNVSRVLKLLSQRAVKVPQSWVCLLGLFWWMRCLRRRHQVNRLTHSRPSVSRSEAIQTSPFPRRGRTIFSIFEWLQLRGLMFTNNVHYSGVHSTVLTQDEGVCACVCAHYECVCVHECVSPEVSCPGGSSVAPPRGPERQRQPLLRNHDQWISHCWTTLAEHSNVREGLVEGISVMAETTLGPECFFCRISWSGVNTGPTTDRVVFLKSRQAESEKAWTDRLPLSSLCP